MERILSYLNVVVILSVTIFFVACSQSPDKSASPEKSSSGSSVAKVSQDIKSTDNYWGFEHNEAGKAAEDAVVAELERQMVFRNMGSYKKDFKIIKSEGFYFKNTKANGREYKRAIEISFPLKQRGKDSYMDFRAIFKVWLRKADGKGEYYDLFGDEWHSDVKFIGIFDGDEKQREKESFNILVARFKAESEKYKKSED